MLDDFISLLFTFVIGFFLFMGGINMYIGTTKWFQLQAETQFIAQAVAQQGGYTVATDSNLRDFLNTRNFDSSQLGISVTPTADASNPDLYGTEVVVKMSYPYDFLSWGEGSPVVSFPLVTYASAMSTFEPNTRPGFEDIQETYTQPQFKQFQGGGI